MFNFFSKKTQMVEPAEALPGRDRPLPTAVSHFVNGNPLKGPYPADTEQAIFGMGCFWGAERKFWQAGTGRLCHGGRLCRRLHAQPDL